MNHPKKILTPLRVSLAAMLVLMIALPLATPALAGGVIEGDPDAIVDADTVIEDDLAITGRLVQIDGIVRGDVFAAGQQVVVNGTIEGNLFVGAQDVTIDGLVEDSLFIGAQTIAVGGEVGDNLYVGAYAVQLTGEGTVGGSVYVGGFSFESAEGSQIGRSIYAGGYQLDLAGNVGRDVLASLGAFQMTGSVAGDVQLEVGQSTDGSGPTPDSFTYYMPGNVQVLPEGIGEVDESNIGGEFDYRLVRYDAPRAPNGNEISGGIAGTLLGNLVRARVGEFMALLIVGALLFTLLPKPANAAVEEMRERPFAHLGWGFLIALLAPLALLISILLLASLAVVLGILTLGEIVGTVLALGGFGLALVWAVFGLLFWMVSKVIFAYLVGESLLERISPTTLDSRWAAVIVLAIGLLLYEIVRAIPLLGALLALFVILIGIGAIFQVLRDRWVARRQAT